MTIGENFFERARPNIEFLVNYRNAVRTVTAGIPHLAVLDFGAGTYPYPQSHFVGFQSGQEPVVAYDPSLTPELIAQKTNESTIWTSVPPTGKEFHMVGAYFSIHHMGNDLKDNIQQLGQFGPILAIADYDFKGKDLETFKQTFVSQMELKELQGLFKGDWEACFLFHSRFSKPNYLKELQEQGYEIAQTGGGKDIAGGKFFIVARKISV